MRKNANVQILDCTLRDGGYINDWHWGYEIARSIVKLLSLANIDIVEVGFLRNISKYDKNITVCNAIEELNKLIPKKNKNTMYSAMAMQGDFNISKLNKYCGDGIELIRVTFHDYDNNEGLLLSYQIKDKGYKVSINPINIMGYTDAQLLQLLDRVNEICPYQFTIVDTFGSMRRNDLERIANLVDHNLDKDIKIGLHLHENMALSYSLAQDFIGKYSEREITVDGSLAGMGRVPGNLPVELLSDYINEKYNEIYDINYMLDAIQEYIKCYQKGNLWGYMPEYFLSARYNLHRNYVEFYMSKGDLTNRDINNILSQFPEDKKTLFDETYADKQYESYMDKDVDDNKARKNLKKSIEYRTVCVIAPGKSVDKQKEKIKKFIKENDAVVFSVNCIPNFIKLDYAFFSSNKRYEKIDKCDVKLIVTSNITDSNVDYILNYNSLYHTNAQGSNSLIMLIHFLKQMGKQEVYLAGADGYSENLDNYFDLSYQSHIVRGKKYNKEVADALRLLDVDLQFLTSSEYQKYI